MATQQEIDAIVKGLQSGEVEAPKPETNFSQQEADRILAEQEQKMESAPEPSEKSETICTGEAEELDSTQSKAKMICENAINFYNQMAELFLPETLKEEYDRGFRDGYKKAYLEAMGKVRDMIEDIQKTSLNTD